MWSKTLLIRQNIKKRIQHPKTISIRLQLRRKIFNFSHSLSSHAHSIITAHFVSKTFFPATESNNKNVKIVSQLAQLIFSQLSVNHKPRKKYSRSKSVGENFFQFAESKIDVKIVQLTIEISSYLFCKTRLLTVITQNAENICEKHKHSETSSYFHHF